MNVLVIEDHPTDRKLLSVVLKMDGHVVHERASAEGAVEAILTATPDVILLDLRLPGMDGLALVRQLKANQETSRIPIVVVTAFPESYPRDELLAAGCDAYIAKPIDTRQLPRQLREVAGKKPE
ncbi:MAG TPA: response regulator [Thermoanaerobaculia bacterium]|nr:response regulator [Thermoanaerobaculia bacterium]